MRRVAPLALFALVACNAPSSAPPPPAASTAAPPSASSVPGVTASVTASASASASAVAAASDAAAEGDAGGDYDVLTNDRFGFSCEYPTFFLKRPADGDGRGQSLYTKDGKATMRCWAMYSHQPAKELYEDWVRRPGLTEKHLDGDTWIVGGHEGADTFYSKSVLSDGLITTVEMHWPTAEDAKYEPMAKHATDSLKLLPVGVRLKNQEAQKKK